MSNVPADPNQDLNPATRLSNFPVPSSGSSSSGRPPADFLPPPNYTEPGQYRTPREFESGAPRPPSRRISVPGVVTYDNQIQDFYDTSREAKTILWTMGDVKRQNVINILYRKGWYGNRKPGSGVSDKDIEVFSELLTYSNLQGQTWDVLIGQLMKAPDMASLRGGGSRVIRPSSEDLTEVLQRTALETVGKKLSDDDVNTLVKTYQRAYTKQSSEQVASADVFFKNRIEQQYGGDSEAYKYLNAISNVQQVLGSL